MKFVIDILVTEILKIEEIKSWTNQVLINEIAPSMRILLSGYIKEYDEQIRYCKEAIEILKEGTI